MVSRLARRLAGCRARKRGSRFRISTARWIVSWVGTVLIATSKSGGVGVQASRRERLPLNLPVSATRRRFRQGNDESARPPVRRVTHQR
jgi:hypothetical protein